MKLKRVFRILDTLIAVSAILLLLVSYHNIDLAVNITRISELHDETISGRVVPLKGIYMMGMRGIYYGVVLIVLVIILGAVEDAI